MDTQTDRRQFLTTLAVPLVLVLVAVFSMFSFQHQTAVWTQENAYNVLEDSAKEQATTLQSILDGRFILLESFGNAIAEQDDPDFNDLMSRMGAIVKASDFLYIAISGPDGHFYMSDERSVPCSDRYYFKEAMAGCRAAQKIKDTRLDGESRMILSVPIKKGEDVVGVVAGGFSEEVIQNFLISSAFSGSAYSFLCDTEGNIIIDPEDTILINQTDNIFSVFKEAKLMDGVTVESLSDDLRNRRSGVMAYSYGTERRYAVYQPFNMNNWVIFNVVNGEVVDSETASQNWRGRISIIVVTLCSSLLILYIAQREKKRLGRLKQFQEEEITYLSTDAMTGLLNAQGFEQAVREALKLLPSSQFCALLDFDINNFTQYNISYGASAGDAVLHRVAESTKQICGDVLPCARLAGERFGVLVTDCNDMEELIDRVQSINTRLHLPNSAQQMLISYGVFVITDRTLAIEEMCVRAAAARLTVAGNYEHFIGVYDEKMHQRQTEDAMLVSNMEEGLALGQFIPYYQPKYDIHTERIVGAEALVRWIRPDGEVKPPDRFIRLFEENGLITRLDRYMFEQVCKKLAAMKQKGEKPVPISVNFSRAHLYDEEFTDTLSKIAQKYHVEPELLEIELTETAFFEQQELLIRRINRLHELGFQISIDDFGSGYSSLNLLKDIAFDVIKIDRGFLSETTETQRGRAVVKSVFTLASELKVHTVAEGVETKEQLTFLKEYGCDTVQGFYFSRPVPEIEFDDLLKRERELTEKLED